MKIREFIRDQFEKHLDAAGCLVIYGGEGRCRDCAADLDGAPARSSTPGNASSPAANGRSPNG